MEKLQEKFFSDHGIGSINELEELPWRVRDASVHYFHRKTDTVYSRSFYDDRWYLASYRNNLRRQYLEHEEYKNPPKKNNETFKEYESKFLSDSEVIQKHILNSNLVIDKLFINDLIQNRLFTAYKFVDKRMCRVGYARELEFTDSKFKKYLDVQNIFYTYPDIDIRSFDFCWNFRAPSEQDIFININGNVTKLEPDDVFTTSRVVNPSSEISLVDKNGNLANDVKYNGLSVQQKTLEQIIQCHRL